MVKNPLVILVEMVVGIGQRTWEEITFVLSKFWDFLVSLSYYSTQSLPLAIFSAVSGLAVTYFVLKYLFKRIPVKFIFTIISGIIIIFVALLLIGFLV